jgi:hypothetical protein
MLTDISDAWKQVTEGAPAEQPMAQQVAAG